MGSFPVIFLIYYKFSLKETPLNNCFLSNIASVNNETFDIKHDMKQNQMICNKPN